MATTSDGIFVFPEAMKQATNSLDPNLMLALQNNGNWIWILFLWLIWGNNGSYSALNCSYLTMIDESFAREQYEHLKNHFWSSTGFLHGFREYSNSSPLLALDIDAGPVIMGLSPSGTAFATGAATYFRDKEVRTSILRTAEIAGNTISGIGKRHYVLANLALVGEAVMLAMRTHTPNSPKK